MDAERRRILKNASENIDEIEQLLADVAHWNRTHPDQEPINIDPDGKLRQMADALRDMLARDAAAGHTGLIEAPLMALVFQKGPKEVQ